MYESYAYILKFIAYTFFIPKNKLTPQKGNFEKVTLHNSIISIIFENLKPED